MKGRAERKQAWRKASIELVRKCHKQTCASRLRAFTIKADMFRSDAATWRIDREINQDRCSCWVLRPLPTIATLLKARGYATGQFGKNHLGDKNEFLPTLHGLDELSPHGRTRPPHLRSWRDGWRHLRFLLLFSPRWLFLFPGIAILAFGVALTALLLPGPTNLAPGITLDIHTFIVGCLSLLIGTQCISFAFISRRFAASRGFVPLPNGDGLHSRYSLERVLIGAGVVLLIGVGGVAYCVWQWAALDFGPIAYPALVRILLISSTLMALAIQVALTAFLSALFEIDG